MQVIQTNIFEKTYKKLHKNQLLDVNKAIKEIMANPFIGEQKKGDLAHIRVYKFKMVKQLTLLAYAYEDEKLILTFVSLGSHSNFYEKLKR